VPDLGTEHLRFETAGPVARCIVDNPAKRNALSMAMYRGLGRAVTAVADDPALGALVIAGVDDVFIVGGDMSDHDTGGTGEDAPLPFELIERGDVPVVAAINGHCQASGVLLAVLADVAVASDRARFRLPELRRGVAAPWSSTLLASVVGLARAKDLALTSRSIDAEEALAMGLIARLVPHADLDEAAHGVALDLLEAAPAARASWKRAAHEHIGWVDHEATERSYRTAEAEEGFAAFVERRPPAWSPRCKDATAGPGPRS
jgi:enoyl-CoA hydratase/carnithine racemase